jgi:predicted PurR-regulated permease PerM
MGPMSISVRPTGVPPGWLRALILPLIIIAWLALAVLFIWVLGHFTRTLLVVVLAVVLAFAFTPLANFFHRWAPRPVAIALAYLVGLCVVFGFGAYVVATAAEQIGILIANLPTYSQQFQAMEPQLEALAAPLGVQPGWLTELNGQAIGEIQRIGGAVATDLIPRAVEFFGTVVDMIVVLILSVYLCLNGTRIAEWLKAETAGPASSHARALVAVINRVIGGYVRGVLVLSVIVGVLVGVGLAVLGVPYAVLMGVLAFFMEFIPVLGVIISGAASVAVALVSFREPIRPLIVLAYFVVVHIIEGDVIGPRIMGRAVGIHPATGLIALIAGTEVFGIWGALFAAPLAGLLQAVAVAAWIEFRGGNGARAVLEAAEQATTERAEDKARETVASS